MSWVSRGKPEYAHCLPLLETQTCNFAFEHSDYFFLNWSSVFEALAARVFRQKENLFVAALLRALQECGGCCHCVFYIHRAQIQVAEKPEAPLSRPLPPAPNWARRPLRIGAPRRRIPSSRVLDVRVQRSPTCTSPIQELFHLVFDLRVVVFRVLSAPCHDGYSLAAGCSCLLQDRRVWLRASSTVNVCKSIVSILDSAIKFLNVQMWN